MPGQAVHPLPTQAPRPPHPGLENTKADPMPDIMCKQEGAALLQSPSATALLKGSEGTEVVWIGVSSPSASGWGGEGAVVTKLREGGW